MSELHLVIKQDTQIIVICVRTMHLNLHTTGFVFTEGQVHLKFKKFDRPKVTKRLTVYTSYISSSLYLNFIVVHCGSDSDCGIGYDCVTGYCKKSKSVLDEQSRIFCRISLI